MHCVEMKMAAGRLTDMKIPTRPAPAPPRSSENSQISRPGSHLLDFDNCDPFDEQSFGGGRKKPPPRPPPPKLQAKSVNRKQASSQLLTNLFTRKTSGRNSNVRSSSEVNVNSKPVISSSSSYGSLQQAPVVNFQSGTLIDLNSPPASPTFTTRSSSDGVESGFEDDFDFFTASSTTTPSTSDPWCDINCPQDPFSPTWRASPSVPPTIFELSNEDSSSSNMATSKPTIIWSNKRNSKPMRPPPPAKGGVKLETNALYQPTSVHERSQDDLSRNASLSNWSPPMPSVPPPPPPPEALQVLLNGPQLPPRPTSLITNTTERKKPYCIALYDYEATHPDDLSFNVNDVITLVSRVNDEWLRGQVAGKEGIFPENFVNIVVPLDEQPADSFDNDSKAIALYTFTPETWDDLEFQEGETVRILKKINDDWFYGECNGKRGQFPASFVSSIYLDIDT